MKKKGGTHVGVVLSFVIFITFLVFLYFIIQPAIRTKTSEQNLLSYLEDDLVSSVSSDITTVSVLINKPTLKNCLKLNDLINKTEIDITIIVKNDTVNTFDSYLKIEGSFGLLIDRTGSETTFFKIISSKEFEPIILNPALTDCEDLNEGSDYIIGSVRTDKYVFESKIKELMGRYRTDYIGTKKALNISTKNDFGFGFTYSNGTTIKTQEVNVSTVIYAEEVPIQYIDTKADIKSGRLNIKLW